MIRSHLRHFQTVEAAVSVKIVRVHSIKWQKDDVSDYAVTKFDDETKIELKEGVMMAKSNVTPTGC